jgi:hypothetical protein
VVSAADPLRSLISALTNDQKQWHINVYLKLQDRANEDPAIVCSIALFPRFIMKPKGRIMK